MIGYFHCLINNSAQLIEAQQKLITKQTLYLQQLDATKGKDTFQKVDFPAQLTAESISVPFAGSTIFNDAVRRENQLGKFGANGEAGEFACPQPTHGVRAKTQLSEAQSN